MRYVVGFACVCALGVVPLVGCGDNNGTGGGNITPITFNVTAWDPIAGSLQPLEGVDFCQIGENYCVMSDSDGVVTLLVPPPRANVG